MKPIITAICITILGACSNPREVDLLISNANIVNVRTGDIIYNQDIWIHDSIIVYIVRHGSIDSLSARVFLEADGKFVIPGLWDMHAHPDDPEVWRMNPSKEARDLLLPQFVINGVTGIRDMAGDLEMVNRWRYLNKEGLLLAPEIIATGPLLDGPNPMWDGSIGINSPSEVPRIVDSLMNNGSDFLKVYSLLPRDTYFALAEYAKKKGYTFVGHVPFTVKPSECASTGMHSQEHLLEILNETMSNPDSLAIINKIEDRWQRYRVKNEYLIQNFDKNKMDSLNNLFIKNDIYHTPTLSMWKKNAWFEEEVIKDDSLLDYLPAYLREYWTIGVNDHLNNRQEKGYVETKQKLYIKYLDIVKSMNNAGVKLLAGTDMGANPLCFPGVGLHNELEELVRAGLTPLEALQTATINPAEFLHKSDTQGLIEEGYDASLVILGAHPLENINNIRIVWAVVHKGKLIDESMIKSINEMIKEEIN